MNIDKALAVMKDMIGQSNAQVAELTFRVEFLVDALQRSDRKAWALKIAVAIGLDEEATQRLVRMAADTPVVDVSEPAYVRYRSEQIKQLRLAQEAVYEEAMQKHLNQAKENGIEF